MFDRSQKAIAVRLTLQELKLLTTLASDQLFSEQFINTRIPGHRANPEGIALGKALVERLRLILDEESSKEAPLPARTSRRSNRSSVVAK